jgi:hypothetical protein
VPDLTPAELQLILKVSDRGSKGYLATGTFIDRLQDFATETKQDVVLRTFALSWKRQGFNVRLELLKYDQ